MFFKDIVTGSGYDQKRKPSVFKEVVLEVLQARVVEETRTWLEANKDAIGKALVEQLNADAEKLVLAALTAMFNQPLMAYKNSMNEAFQRLNISERIY